MTIKTLTTETLPFAIIDGIGFFTVFTAATAAQALAEGMATQDAADGLTGTEYAIVERKDGKWLVVGIEAADELCHYIPHSMLRP